MKKIYKTISMIIGIMAMASMLMFNGCDTNKDVPEEGKGTYEEIDYNKNVEAVGELNREEVIALRQEYFEYVKKEAEGQGKTVTDDMIECIRIMNYYGELNGYPVIVVVNTIWGETAAVMEKVVIDGVEIGEFDASNKIVLQNKSADIGERFVDIETAYEKGQISRDDLTELAARCAAETQQ